MKKFYTLLVAAACTAGASAANLTMVADKACASDALQSEITRVNASAIRSNAPAKTPAALPTGDWNVIGMGQASEGLLYDVDGVDNIEPFTIWDIEIEQSATDASWYRTKLYNEDSPLMDLVGQGEDTYFYFNVADPNKVFAAEYSIVDETYMYYQWVPESGIDEMLVEAGKIDVQNNPRYAKLVNNVVYFQGSSMYYLDVANSVFRSVDAQSAFRIALPGTAMPEAWINLGETTFYDGIIGQLIGLLREGGDPNNEDDYETGVRESTVTVQELSYSPGFYRVLDAWSYYWQSENPLILNAANPEEVKIPQQPTADYEGVIYIQDPSAFQLTDEQRAAMTSTMDETRTINIPKNGALISWAVFGTGWYTMKDEFALPSKITIPEAAGVNNVVVDNSNAPVEYFNLQGIRVANPENGLYIRRQGNTATKVLIRN